MKRFVIVLLLFIVSGCYFDTEKHGHSFLDNENYYGKEVSGVYKGDITNHLEESAKKDFYYLGEDVLSDNRDFYEENNTCLVENYLIAIVVAISDDSYVLEVGSNCFDRSQQGPTVRINVNDVFVENMEFMKVFGYVKIYYQFPMNFKPSSYLDYLNFATKIVVEK